MVKILPKEKTLSGFERLQKEALASDFGGVVANRYLTEFYIHGDGCSVDFKAAYVHNEMYRFLWDKNSAADEKLSDYPESSKAQIYQNTKQRILREFNEEDLAAAKEAYENWLIFHKFTDVQH